MLGRNPLFAGLPADVLEGVTSRMTPRAFEAGDVVCRAGEPGDSLFLIARGLARVIGPDASQVLARLRRGDVIGEMSLVSGAPRSATVVAAAPTTALELDRDDFAALIGSHPEILSNLNRILTRRLAETTARIAGPRARGEAVALVVGEAGSHVLPQLVESTEAASPAPVASLDARAAPEAALAALDDLLADHGTVLVPVALGQELLAVVLEAVDRRIALVSGEPELEDLAETLSRGSLALDPVEVVLLQETPGPALPTTGTSLVRVVSVEASGEMPARDCAWLGRHLTRTKIGVALGAGGAKGYAHIGVLQVLERAGYTVDAVAGSSIGAIVGAWLGLGMGSAEIEATMRHAFRPEIVEDVFKLSFSGASTGLEAMTRVLKESTGERTFDDLLVPLVVMSVGLDSRAPEPITDGPLWEALLAATALAGMFPPYERNGHRLVDGLALVPVPTEAVVEAGADVTVSVDIIGGDLLPAWPGEEAEPEEPRPARARMLDTLLEVMDLAQLDSSRRHAARADVVCTPRFAPSSWRDFNLADRFLEAGRRAAEEQLPALEKLVRPQPSNQR